MNIEAIIEKSLMLLEEKRKEYFMSALKIISGIYILYFAFVTYAVMQSLPISLPVLIISGFFVMLIAFIIVTLIKSNKFTAYYKEALITPLVGQLFPELTYDAKGHISEIDFERSSLFRGFNRYYGDDYFEGTINGNQISFSELYVAQESRRNHGTSSTRVIFKGVFAQLKCSSLSVSKPITIKANRGEVFNVLPSFIKGFIEKFMPDYGPQITIGDSAFDSEYTVHCDDEALVHELITDEFIAGLNSLTDRAEALYDKKEMQSTASIRFAGNEIFIAIPSKEIFTVRFYRSLLGTKDSIIQYCDLVKELMNFAKIFK
ncbi:MAG: DUF3137 domain-containing protein [Leptospiraceae bacterium]|nr:DUF3137 domain-containing protein [Leptospiraceae bacterium]